jgi:very-short-patch-repair endonuclease
MAASQYGVFSREQAIAKGLDRSSVHRRVAAGRWDRIHPQVFRVRGTDPTWLQALFGAWLCWGDGTAASHRTALTLWSMPGAVRELPELTVPPDRGRNHACRAIIHRSVLHATDIAAVGVIPVTTPTRTLIDIAAILPRDVVEEALDDALRRKLTTVARMRWRIEALARPGRRGIGVIRALVAERAYGSVPDSVFETRLLRKLRAAGLTDVVSQYPIRHGNRVIAVVDFAFPAERVAIEADGYKWHTGRARWKHDLSRRNALTGLGWKVDHVTWDELNSDAVIERLRALLGR